MGEIAQELLDRFSDPSHPFNDRLHEIAEFIESLQAQNAELKKENDTLRATAELVERADHALRNGWDLCPPADDDPQYIVIYPCGKPHGCTTLREALEALGETK